jgi:hypothetical protein
MSQVICEFCKTTLSSKYVLKNHINNNKACLSLRNLELKTDFLCSGCIQYSVDLQRLNAHHEICKPYQRLLLVEEHENEIKEIKDDYKLKLKKQDIQHKKDISDKDKEINSLKEQHKKELCDLTLLKDEKIKDLQAQLDKMFSTIEKLASQAIDKPNTTNVTTNNVNVYSDKYFLEDIKPEEVKKKCQNYLTEQVFFSGQRGIAQLCTDHIIKTKDNKVLLTCSDVSRKKFKYIDENGNLKEDHEARTFTKKVFEPIKQASQVVYENILSDIKDEQEQLEDDYNRKSALNDKTMKAIDCFAQIVNIDNPSCNNDFKNELAILNK